MASLAHLVAKVASPRIMFPVLFLLASSVFLLHYAYVGNGVWGDGRYYYVFVRSWVINHDIDFQNERLVNPFYFDYTPTPIGRAGNKYAIGTPFVWLPAYTAAHAINLTGHSLGLPVNPDGYGHSYRLAIGLWSIGLVTAALFFIHQTLKHLYPRAPHLPVVLSLGLGTHLFYYLALDPITSHAPSVFISSLIVYALTLKPSAISHKQLAITLGLLTGLLGMIRPHDLIFIFPILYILKEHHFSLIMYLLSSFITFTPQLLSQWLLYGTLKSPYFLTGSGFSLSNTHFIEVLFSPNNGLFYYSPLWIIGVLGLIKHFNSYRTAKIGLTLFVLQTLVLGSWSGWWGGESFGGRMFLSLTPFIALGLAAMYQTLSKKLQIITISAATLFTTAASFHYLLTH